MQLDAGLSLCLLEPPKAPPATPALVIQTRERVGPARESLVAEHAELLRSNLFFLNTRRFGAVAELLVQRLAGFVSATGVHHDLHDPATGSRVEVKFSRVLRKCEAPLTESNIFQALAAAGADRSLPYAGWEQQSFDCNIQQVKPVEFDQLYYGLVFCDRVLVFRASSTQVLAMPQYSSKQHKGNEGEGQFHITSRNLQQHRDGFLFQELDYLDLARLLSCPPV